jgi:hypothetical protein
MRWFATRLPRSDFEATQRKMKPEPKPTKSTEKTFSGPSIRYCSSFMRTVQIVTAKIGSRFGAAVFFVDDSGAAAARFVARYADALTVARVGSAGLLALGVTCWLARGDTQSRAARGLVAAMLLYDIPPSLSSLSPALAFGMKGLWPAVVLHAVMIVWCITHLLRSSLNVTKNGHLQNIPD